MYSLLLQATATATQAISDTAAALNNVAPGTGVDVAEQPSISLIDLIFKGGWVMIPIFILSLVSIFIIIERFLAIKKASPNPEAFMSQLKGLILKGDIEGAKMLAGRTNTPIARMMEKGVKRLGQPLKDIETAVENVGKLEVAKLERNLNVLGIIAGIAPMLGFVGTISGVIKIFYNISLADNISIGLIAGGLYEKMVTSAAGLIVGIIAHIGYHWLTLMVERQVFKMENYAVEFTDLLQEN